MKFNKSIANVGVSIETKKYVNNYINECIKLMYEQGSIEEFIWYHTDDLNKDLRILLECNIITFGEYNEEGILIPHVNSKKDFSILHYMLTDKVLLENGFKVPVVKEKTKND